MKLPPDFDLLNQQEKEQWLSAQNCIEALKEAYVVAHASQGAITHFELLKHKVKPSCLHRWHIRRANLSFVLCLVRYGHTYSGTSKTKISPLFAEDLYFFGHLQLTKDHGRMIVRQETLQDKINELFTPVEIDFPSHPKFSHRYYVLADTKENIEQRLPGNLRDFIQNISGLELEFRGHECLFRLPKAINEKESMALCKIGLVLDDILNDKLSE